MESEEEESVEEERGAEELNEVEEAEEVEGQPGRKRKYTKKSKKANKASARVEQIRKGAHFNFIKLHLLTHVRSHVERYGNVPMFSTDVSELSHREQIKESYRKSKKVDATLQILDNCSQQHAF